MAIEYSKNYWENEKSETIWEVSSYQERKDAVLNFTSAQRKIARGTNDTSGYQEMLEGKKAWADSVIFEKEKSQADFELLRKNNGLSGENIQNVEEYNTIINEVNLQSQIEYLQLYYDSYMMTNNSDAQWRLGNLQGTLKNAKITDEKFGEVINGSVQTRSNMSYMYDWQYLNQNGNSGKTQKFFSSMGFPPYKFGPTIKLGKKTNRMQKVLNSTFDQDNFMVTREDLTLRDIGMKTLSDWINYLQWVAEGSTGIVSTYLTEWDLSIYIQEGLMLPKINGGPMDVYLNYRIRQDNPLANTITQKYIDDRALAFNVCGSSVSKLFFDCLKTWRPSDYPLSAWWMPYLENRDWTLAGINLKSAGLSVPYMSFYDDLVVDFAYKSQTDLREIFKHQDYIGLIARAANTMENPYWSAFYSSESDGSTNMDIKMRNLINQVAGAEPNSCGGRDLSYLKTIGKKECIMNGGYFGGPVTVDQNGGLFGRTMVGNTMDSEGDPTGKSEQSYDAQTASSGSENSETYVASTTDSPAKSSVMSNKKDASQMSKLIGINRLSPAIYGGPHSSDYSPYHLRDYFKSDSLVTHQIPKIGYSNLSSGIEVSKEKSTAIEEGKYIFSPTKALAYLKEGTYQYAKKLVYCKDKIKKTFEGIIFFNNKTLEFEVKLPENYNGSKIIYDTNKLYYKTKVYSVNALANEIKNKWWKFIFLLKQSSSEVFMKIPVCDGTYEGFIEKTVKFYEMQDYPDLRWKITAHKFLEYSTKVGRNEELFIGSVNSKGNQIKDDYKEIASKAGYVLTCASSIDEENIKQQLIKYNKGITDSPKELYFCGCDSINDRYTKGPSYIFKAKVYLKYYTNVTEIWKKVLWFKTLVRRDYTYMPYIYVDLANTIEFFDLTSKDIKIERNSEELPGHLITVNKSSDMVYSPLQKLKTGLIHTITSFKSKETSSGLMNFFFGKSSQAVNDGHGTIQWTTTSNIGIEGIGILSGWQGIDTAVDTFETIYGKYDIKDYILRKSSNYDNVKIRSLPLSAVVRGNQISWRLEKNPHIMYMSSHGYDAIQSYSTKKLDTALKNAINNISTSVYFKQYGSENISKISIKEPIINFISYCQTELNYLNMANDVFNTLNFELIRKLLLNNVDACVLKASGLKKIDNDTFIRVKSDKKHILYNYWIEEAIQLFYDKTKHDFYKKQINEKFNELKSALELTVETVSTIIKKDPLDFTYDDWKTIMGQIYIQEENTVKNIIDEFFFAYLNILYCYRLYFIGKRFNKEDGTMWAMRQLESTIDLVHTNEEPAKSPKELNDDDKNIYNVVFYELQNTLDLKREVIIDENHPPLTVDKIYRVYVKVEYGTENDWKRWIAYRDDSNKNPKAHEVIRMNVDGETRYVFKPADGLYQFKSKEWNDNLKNEEWNYNHKDQPAKDVKDYINCIFPIEWKPVKGKTPIRWNVLGSVNVDNLLEYSHESISAQDLVCLTEEGADFWTITIPANMWPEKELYKTKLYIKHITEPIDVYNDIYTVVAGPFANSVSPIRSYDGKVLERLKEEISFLK